MGANRFAARAAFVATWVAIAGAASAAWTGQDASRAQELLAQAREALGGEAQLKAIQSLSISGWARHNMGIGSVEADLSIDVQMPDKFRKSETMSPVPNASFTAIEIVSGEQVILDSESSGGNGMMFNAAGMGQRSPQAKAALERDVRAEYARTMIFLLLAPPAAIPVEFSYAGVEETSGNPADVLEAKGSDGFFARLHVDQKSHLPVLLTYKERTRGGMVFRGAAGDEEAQRATQEMMKKAGSPGNEVDVQLRFSDYKATGGILFPHKVTKMTGDRVTEEREYSKFKINPTLKAERFKKKEQ